MISQSFLIALLLLVPSFMPFQNKVDFSLEEKKEDPSPAVEEAAWPKKNTESLGVKINAKSALVIDEKTGMVLFSKNPSEKLPMASLTKTMTSIIALEKEKDLSRVVAIDNEMILLEGGKIKLLRDEQITLEDLIKGALISSGNDAATAVGKTVGHGSIEAFVKLMNDKADSLGLKDTRFDNPSGLDFPNHYSTAFDLAKLFSYALENKKFREIVGTKEAQAHALNVNKVHYFRNTNKLLWGHYPYMKGGKTGFTDNARYCLISNSSHNENDEIITVVLGSNPDGQQFQDSKALIEWTYQNYEWPK